MAWKYSITLSSFRDVEPVSETLEKVSKLPFDAVEMYGEPDEVNVKSVLNLVNSYNMSISGITGMWGGSTRRSQNRKLVTKDKSLLRQTINYIERCILLCEQIGGQTFNLCLFSDDSIPSIDKNHGNLQDNEKRRVFAPLIEPLRQLGRFAKNRGVEILIEPLNRYSTPVCNTANDAAYLVDSVGQEAVGMLLDTFHMNIEEDSMEEAIIKSGAALKVLHLSDNNRKMPGFGHIDFVGIMKSLKRIDFNRYLSFEPFIPYSNYSNDIKFSIDKITSL